MLAPARLNGADMKQVSVSVELSNPPFLAYLVLVTDKDIYPFIEEELSDSLACGAAPPLDLRVDWVTFGPTYSLGSVLVPRYRWAEQSDDVIHPTSYHCLWTLSLRREQIMPNAAGVTWNCAVDEASRWA